MGISKRTSIIIIVIAIVICVGGFVGLRHIVIEDLNNFDRGLAIQELSELKGRIREVKSLYYEDISQDILLNELEDLTTQRHFISPYLKDFVFIIPDTSNVRELCEELISQINDQIYTIKFGTRVSNHPCFLS